MTIVYRPAERRDIQAILDLAVASVTRDPLPVRVSRDYMRDMALDLIGKPQHFVWVAEDCGKVVACVAACTQLGFWFERQQCSVLLFYGTRVGHLLVNLANWIKSRPVIKMAVIEFEPAADPRLIKFARRLGFTRQSTNLTYVRGLS